MSATGNQTNFNSGGRGKIIATVVLCLAGVGVLFLLLNRSRSPLTGLEVRKPGTDNVTGAVGGDGQSPVTKGQLIVGTGKAAEGMLGTWPLFRGANLDMIFKGSITLSRDWPKEGPPKLWSVTLGQGHAGAAIHKGRVYLFDYDEKEKGDVLRCLSLADGKEIWRYFYPIKTKRNHGMSRTVPAVTDKYVVAIGPKNHVLCVETDTGKFVWGLDLVKDFGSAVPEWYAGQCPLIDGENVILAPSGDCMVMAVELATGKVVWRSPNPRDWKMTHTSLTPMEFAGKRFYIYSASLGVAGIDAADGSLLWESEAWKVQIAACASPVVVGKDKIFFSGGYNAGCMLAQLKEKDGKIFLEEIWRLKATQFGSTQQTPILYQDHLYGVRPDGQFACVNLDGKVVWTSSAAERFGLGPYLLANGLFYILSDDGRLVLAEANTSEYRRLTQGQVLHGHDACGPMALADGRLLCRDLTEMVCLNVTGGK